MAEVCHSPPLPSPVRSGADIRWHQSEGHTSSWTRTASIPSLATPRARSLAGVYSASSWRERLGRSPSSSSSPTPGRKTVTVMASRRRTTNRKPMPLAASTSVSRATATMPSAAPASARGRRARRSASPTTPANARPIRIPASEETFRAEPRGSASAPPATPASAATKNWATAWSAPGTPTVRPLVRARPASSVPTAMKRRVPVASRQPLECQRRSADPPVTIHLHHQLLGWRKFAILRSCRSR